MEYNGDKNDEAASRKSLPLALFGVYTNYKECGGRILERCKNVWLAVSGLVISDKGEWLVVNKRYGGLKGQWSLPAGFVKNDETVDEAVVREVLEETGIQTEIEG